MKFFLGVTTPLSHQEGSPVTIINSSECFKLKHSIFKKKPLPLPIHVRGRLCFFSKLFNI